MTLTLGIPEKARSLAPDVDVDFERMRRYRLSRIRQAMAEAGHDVLMLGTGANIQYVSGARRLWHAGNSPFTPMGVLVRETGARYLLSYTTDGIPDDIPVEHLCPVSWDPRNLLAFLSHIREIRHARRIGVDGMTPFFARALPQIAPHAAFVSAQPALERARSIKSQDEIGCLRIATRIAEQALATTQRGVRPAVLPRQLRAIAMESMTAFGTTIAGHDGLFAALPKDPDIPFARLIGERPIAEGDHVAISLAATFAGYEGNVGRTVVCGAPAVQSAALIRLCGLWEEKWRSLKMLLRPGVRVADLQAHLSEMARTGARIAINGVGMGMEPPLLHGDGKASIGIADVLEAGMALVVESHLCARDRGGYYCAATLVVTDQGCDVLARAD